jgi:hypothetical protein
LPKPNSPYRRGARRIGADADFARALARQEFGRFYWNDRLEAELRGQLGKPEQKDEAWSRKRERPAPARKENQDKATTTRAPLWQPPRLREQRQKLAEARARLLNGQRERKGPTPAPGGPSGEGC